MKILLIHLVRLGDVIQTLGVVDCIVAENPDAEVHFLLEASFSFFAEQHSGITKAIPFSSHDFPELSNPEVIQSGISGATRSFVEALNRENYDLAINLQHNAAGPALLHFIDAKQKRGSCLDGRGRLQLLDPWTEYLFLVAKSRKDHGLNLADIYCRIAGVALRPDVIGTGFSSGLQAGGGIFSRLRDLGNKSRPLVAFQLGASEPWRRWPLDFFVTLVKEIHQTAGAQVVILGDKSEVLLAESLARQCTESLNLCGKTDLEELIGVLKEAAMLVTNDTGTMHLAAYLGTPVLAIGMSEVSAAQTGPVTNGDIIYVEPVLDCYPCERPEKCVVGHACQAAVRPEIIGPVLKRLLQHQALSEGDGKAVPARFLKPLSQDSFFQYIPTTPFPFEFHGAFSHLVRWLLPIAWQEVHGYKSEDPGVYGRIAKTFDCWYQARREDWERMQEALRNDAARTISFIEEGKQLVAAYQDAIARGDKIGRRTAAQSLEALDREATTLPQSFSFLGRYYSLECRMQASRVTSLEEMLHSNSQIFERMVKMITNLNASFESVRIQGKKSTQDNTLYTKMSPLG